MLNSAIRTSFVISGLAILLASCQTTITTTTVPTTYKLVRETIEPISRRDVYSIERIDVGNVHLLRYGESVQNERINGSLVLRDDSVRTSSNRYGRFYEGKADIGDGLIENIYTYEDDDYPALYADLVTLRGGGYFLEVGGERDVSIPRGRHTYTGTNIFAVEGELSQNRWGRGSMHGYFKMTVDFDASEGTIDGETPTVIGLDGSEISGDFGVNTEKGTFSGRNLIVKNRYTLREYETEIYGSFHGDRAGGVTGLYVEQQNSPLFFGAIVGVAE